MSKNNYQLFERRWNAVVGRDFTGTVSREQAQEIFGFRTIVPINTALCDSRLPFSFLLKERGVRITKESLKSMIDDSIFSKSLNQFS